MTMSLIVDLDFGGYPWIQHLALNILYRYYADDNSVSLDPPIVFGHQHRYSTKAPPILLIL